MSGNSESDPVPGLSAALARAASLPEPTRKGWTATTLEAMGVGLDAANRFVFPILNAGGEFAGTVRYADDGRDPKMRADTGTTRDLWPRPEDVPGPVLIVVEGEPDAVSLMQLGYPAVALPGVGKWSEDWSARIGDRREAVFFVCDCDAPGRARMTRGAAVGSEFSPTFVIDIAPDRSDGYDVGDMIAHDGPELARTELASMLDAARQFVPDPTPTPPAMPTPAATNGDDRHAVVIRANEVPIRSVQFLWRPFLPLGKVTILAGAPGQGKSQLTAFMAAHTTHATFYDSDVLKPGRALVMTAEDDLADTAIPRLQAAGADLSRVDFVVMRRTMPRGITTDGLIRLPGDIDTLHALLEAGDVRLVVFDPVASFVGREHSTYVNQDVRDMLDPLVALAAHYGVAMVLILHLNKSESKSWATKIGESHAFQAVARTVLALAPDPDDEDGEDGSDKILAATKLNLLRRGRGFGLKLRVEPATVYTNDMVPVETSTLKIMGRSSVAADDLLADQTERGSRRQTLDFLLEILAAGPMESKPLQRAAKEAGVAWRGVERYYREVCKPAKPAMSRGPWVYELHESHLPTHTPGEHGGHTDKSAMFPPGVGRGPADTDPDDNGSAPIGEHGGQTTDELREYRKRRDAMLGERWEDDDE